MPATALLEPHPSLVALRPARADAYATLAPWYDTLTEGYEYEAWLTALERLLDEHGRAGRRLFDVGCGTGKSFLPMLRRGYDVTACDLSPAMVERARRKLGPDAAARVFVADMRALPPVGPFDLVTCLDDAVNHLLSDADLAAALAAIGRVLRPGGLAVFDVNSLRTYRSAFASDHEFEQGDVLIRVRGEGSDALAPGELSAATIEIRECTDGRLVSANRQVQRHHPRAAIASACRAAGLELAAVRGQLPGARIESDADELHHTKVLYVVRRPPAGER